MHRVARTALSGVEGNLARHLAGVMGRVSDGCVGGSDPSRPSKTLGALLLAWGRPPFPKWAELLLGFAIPSVSSEVSL